MQGFVITLLTCSATMSALCLVYMAFMPLLTRRYSEKGCYYAWLIIVIGLIIPFRPHFESAIVKVDMPPEVSAPIILAVNPVTTVMPSEATTLPVAAQGVSIWQIAAVVWMIGALSFIVYHGIKHYRYLKMTARWSESIVDEQIRDLLHSLKTEIGISKQIGLYSCSSIGGPVLIGFINPRILLPQTVFTPEELRFILKHELIHYKRGDLFYKYTVLIATAIHWFNPIVYLMGRAIDAACELSCDAETVRETDTEIRQQYSETIIGVIKHQSKLKTALSTNFYGGKRGMKKRIVSIMDSSRKKTGVAILCGVFLLTMGTGMAFAANANKPSEQLSHQLNAQAVAEADQSMMSRIDPATGKTLYSWDLGETWTPLTDEEYDAMFPTPVFEWWTYDEYKVWMEKQIAGLQAVADDGVPDYYDDNDVLRDFTQADVDEFAANYNEILNRIKNGIMVSKTVDGSTDTSGSYDPRNITTAQESNAAVGNSWSNNDTEQNYDEYAQFGITCRDGKLYYNGEPVRCFDDWYSLGEDMYAGRSFFDKDGTVDVFAERDFSRIVHNPDGSYDPSGKLVGVKASSQAEFDARDLSQYTESATPSITAGASNATNSESSPIATGNTYIINAASEGDISLSGGRTIVEIFEDYAEFGVTFDTNCVKGGLGNIYYNGKLVKQFTDIAPNGGVFSCSSSDGGDIKVRTVYDETGKLAGLEVI